MNTRRQLLDELKPILELHFDNDLPDGAWFRNLEATVENHFAKRRIKPSIEPHDLVMDFLKYKQSSHLKGKQNA